MLLEKNPELQKYRWLEISSQRLIIMPAIIIISILAFASFQDGNIRTEVNYMAYSAFIIITIWWGSKNASDSIINEINDNTWDWQQMSAQSPWRMTIGKIFGSTIYNWYGGIICLFVYVLTINPSEFGASFSKIIQVVLGAITFNSLAILLALQKVKRKSNRKKLKSNLILLIIILFSSSYFTTGLAKFSGSFESASWYNLEINAYAALVVSSLFYAFWAVVGVYRSLREELKFKQGIKYWIIFLISNAFFFSGFYIGALSEFAQINIPTFVFLFSFATYAILSYVMLFNENKSFSLLRYLVYQYEQKNFRKIFENIPLWVPTVAITLVLGILTLISFAFGGFIENVPIRFDIQIVSFPLFIANVVAFMLRDFFVILLLNFSKHNQRADAVSLLYLVCVYALLPIIFNSVDLAYLFIPAYKGNALLSTFFAIIEASVVGYFLFTQIAQRFKALNDLSE